jgi:hypothetical protein
LFNPCEEDPEKSHQNWTTPALHEGRFEMFYFKENVARLSLDDRKECQFIFAAMPCGKAKGVSLHCLHLLIRTIGINVAN